MINISTITQTQDLAHKLANAIDKPVTICLIGDLGVGKTTFAQFFIRSKIKDNLEITSPTFSIIQIYDSLPAVLHCDFYRLNNPHELSALGIEEFFDKAIILLEWPEIAATILPKDRIELTFIYEDENSRKVNLEFLGQCQNLKPLFEGNG